MNFNMLLVPVILPFISGIVTLLIPKKVKWLKEILTVVILGVCFYFGVRIFIDTRSLGSIVLTLNIVGVPFNFLSTSLSSFILMLGTFLVLLVALYSIKSMKDNPRINQYYTYLLWTLTASAIAVLADNLVLLLVVWGAIAVLLYLLILMGKPGAEKAGYKALIMIGGSDVLMLIGAGIIYYLSGTLTMSQIKLPLDSALSIIAFLLLIIGAFTKAGVMPFHTWILDSAETAPAPVLALFPSIIDKLLGVYLLIRIVHDFFIVIPASAMSILLMSIGSLTIISAASMALMERKLFKLLAYSTVSQVGYMVLGIGTGTPIGLIGALFHMFNNTVYKTALFFGGGAVEMQTKETDLDNLGGLAKMMPITFIVMFISAFSISGIPPLSGFFSKWLIYQSLIGNLSNQSWYMIIFVILAMLGSVLTLAYFLKLLYLVFWKPTARITHHALRPTLNWSTYLPMIILAVITVFTGIFAQLPLRYFFAPILGIDVSVTSGFFNPGLTTILILLSIIIGVVIFFLTRSRTVRTSEVFTGGEKIEEQEGISGADFYDSVKKIKVLDDTYKVADSNFFDIFEQAKKSISLLVKAGQKIHNGLLQTYLGWLLLGVAAIIVTFLIILLK